MQSRCLELVCVWYRAGAWNWVLARSSFLEQSGPCSGRVRVWLGECSSLQRSWLAEQNIVFSTECDSIDFIISDLLLLVFFSRDTRGFTTTVVLWFDVMRRTQRNITPPGYLGYNSDSQLSVSTPTSNGRTGLTQAMQDLQIEDVLPETDPNLESQDEHIMMEAFGASLDKSTCLDHSIWTERWVKSVRLPKRLYTLPNDIIGRKYVDLLTHELKLLSTTADSTSERVLVMSRVLLQRDPMIKASKDIRTLLIGRRIEDWKENKFDEMWQKEANKSRYLDDKHVSKVFASLMMKG